MESFYQESGRAGRDQQPSKSVLYYGLDDRRRMVIKCTVYMIQSAILNVKTEVSVVLQEFILRNSSRKKQQPSSSSPELSEKALADFSQVITNHSIGILDHAVHFMLLYLLLLTQIVDYCESSCCRRKKIIESFGEKVWH